jgi:hypothetical protein
MHVIAMWINNSCKKVKGKIVPVLN